MFFQENAWDGSGFEPVDELQSFEQISIPVWFKMGRLLRFEKINITCGYDICLGICWLLQKSAKYSVLNCV